MVPVDQVFKKLFPYYVISFVAVVNGLFISSVAYISVFEGNEFQFISFVSILNSYLVILN